MPQAAQSSGGQQTPGTMGVVWGIALILVSLGFIWYFAHVYIVKGFFYIKLFEISIIQFFANVLEETRTFIVNADPSKITLIQLTQLADKVGYYLRFPCAIILFLMAVVLYYKSSIVKYKKTYDMKKLLRSGIQVWPQESVIADLDLVKEDINSGPWAMALSPMMFAKKYKLLKLPKDIESRSKAEKEKIVATIKKDKASRIFTEQMGRLWEGPNALNIHTKAIYAAFAAKAARQSEESKDFLYKIASSARAGKLDFTGTNVLLQKYKDYPAVKEIEKRHSYVFTVMASLLQLARTDGVLPSSDFLWLKPVDRKLWFMLNAVGRQVVTTEVAGPFAHWLAEKETGVSIKTPMIEEAVKGLEEAISNIIYKPDSKESS